MTLIPHRRFLMSILGSASRALLQRRLARVLPTPTERLSKRELEVLVLVASGLNAREIGRRLFVSPWTVRNHVRVIYRKAGIRSRAQAALLAVHLDLPIQGID